MTNQRDTDYLKSMLEAMENIRSHQGEKASPFLVNRAVVYELVTIGEAASKLSVALRERFPDVPWRKIIDARHRMVHGYLEIDYDRVWDIVENHLPDLREQIETIIKAVKD